MSHKNAESNKLYHDWECGEEFERFTENRVCDSVAHASRYSSALQKWIQTFGGGSTQAFVKQNGAPKNSSLPWWQQKLLPPLPANNYRTLNSDDATQTMPSTSLAESSVVNASEPHRTSAESSAFFVQPVFVESQSFFGHLPRCLFISHDVLFPLSSNNNMPHSTETLRAGGAREADGGVFKCFLCTFQQPTNLPCASIQLNSAANKKADVGAQLSTSLSLVTNDYSPQPSASQNAQNDTGFLRFLTHLYTQHGPQAQSLELDLDLPHSKLYFRLSTITNDAVKLPHRIDNIIQQMSTGRIRQTLEAVKIPPRTFIHSVSGRPINPITEASLLLGNTTRVAATETIAGFDATDSDEEPLPKWQECMSMWQTNDYIDISPEEKWLLQTWKLFALSCGLCSQARSAGSITVFDALRQFIGVHLRDLSLMQQQTTKVNGDKADSSPDMVKWLSVLPLLGTFCLQGAINHNELEQLRRLFISTRTDLMDKTKENDNVAVVKPAAKPKPSRSILRTPSLSSRKASNESSQSTAVVDASNSSPTTKATGRDTSGVFMSARSNRQFWFDSPVAPSVRSPLAQQPSRRWPSTVSTSTSTPTRSVAALTKNKTLIKILPPRRARSGGRK